MHGPQPRHSHEAALSILSAQTAAEGRGGSTLADEAYRNQPVWQVSGREQNQFLTLSIRKREHLLVAHTKAGDTEPEAYMNACSMPSPQLWLLGGHSAGPEVGNTCALHAVE